MRSCLRDAFKNCFMKRIFVFGFAALLLWSCHSDSATTAGVTSTEENTSAGQSAVKDDESQKDVDHTTLVTAIKKAELVDALSNAGPFTVFAPTNAAFEKLPPGTVDDLLKPENKEKLQDILQYHVYVGSLNTNLMQDGQTLNQVNGGNITISKGADGKVKVNNAANVIASIPASNGIIHVVDAVFLAAK